MCNGEIVEALPMCAPWLNNAVWLKIVCPGAGVVPATPFYC